MEEDELQPYEEIFFAAFGAEGVTDWSDEELCQNFMAACMEIIEEHPNSTFEEYLSMARPQLQKLLFTHKTRNN